MCETTVLGPIFLTILVHAPEASFAFASDQSLKVSYDRSLANAKLASVYLDKDFLISERLMITPPPLSQVFMVVTAFAVCATVIMAWLGLVANNPKGHPLHGGGGYTGYHHDEYYQDPYHRKGAWEHLSKVA